MSQRSDAVWDRLMEAYRTATGKEPLSDWYAWESWLHAYVDRLSPDEQAALTQELNAK